MTPSTLAAGFLIVVVTVALEVLDKSYQNEIKKMFENL